MLANLFTKRQFKEAERLASGLLGQHPDWGFGWKVVGASLGMQGNYKDSISAFEKAIRFFPRDPECYKNLGLALKKEGRDEEAITAYRHVAELSPDDVSTHNSLGVLLQEQKRYEEAEAFYRQALRIKPDYAEARSNLGNLLMALKRHHEAEAFYREALRIKPDYADAHFNLGILLHGLKRYGEAEISYREALRIKPDAAEVSWNLSLLLLFQGRLAEGWPLYEFRYHPARKQRESMVPDVAIPQWHGEELSGKSLLVFGEQGFGDEIQFCRYMPVLKARGIQTLTLVCRPQLKPLFMTLSGVDQVWSQNEWAEKSVGLAPHDAWTFLLSIPRFLGTTLANLPAGLPYLHPIAERIAFWSPRLPESRFRVGLVWKGRVSHPNDANRSLPGIAALAPLWSVPGVSFVSLQKGSGEEEAKRPPQGQPLTDLSAYIRDFADTAAIVSQLDLVICVDTAIAHLCGALGKSCWVLVPCTNPDWRWMESRDDSPWYPNAMRLFRQKTPDGWSSVIQELAAGLSEIGPGP